MQQSQSLFQGIIGTNVVCNVREEVVRSVIHEGYFNGTNVNQQPLENGKYTNYIDIFSNKVQIYTNFNLKL